MGICFGAPVNHSSASTTKPATLASRYINKNNGFVGKGVSTKKVPRNISGKRSTGGTTERRDSKAQVILSKSSSRKNYTEAAGGVALPLPPAAAATAAPIECIPKLKEFTLADLKKCTRDFRPDTILGEGGFGRVFKGWVDPVTYAPSKVGVGLAVAVKKSSEDSYQGHQEWQAEVNFLGKCHHPNLVRLLGHCCEESQFLLVYEYMPKGSLEGHLFRKGQQPLPWEIRLKIAIGAARGLVFLHTSEKVIYRDFKASNILLDPAYNAKLSDFGLVKTGPMNGNSHVTTRIIGTHGYAAPEYVATGHLYVKSDVYGFGVVLLEMLTGLPAVDSNRPSCEYSLVDLARPSLHKKKWLKKIMDPGLGEEYSLKGAFQAAELILKCLEPDPKSRPSMEEVLTVLEKINDIKKKPKCTKSNGRRHDQEPYSSAHNHHSSNRSPYHQKNGGVRASSQHRPY
ncbi:probable serine/threonine-protein kinase PIX13 isoform X2 [Pyrus x bretschneideri]|uniref:probable serine/threonine-protein kinase PIX13 isoform X2 n=1 Tax=Pyrus x bretschneideri TaxID=225117 RepID=UPI00202FBA93|nr:probable serine/threonine-protein kinase PIX13 isoform X2 [Pyrus x bretschneideri]